MIAHVPSSAELDYVIGINAHEESRLPELLADVRQTYCTLGEMEAKSLLQRRLANLVETGRVGMLVLPSPSSSDGAGQWIELSAASALELIASESAWDWDTDPLKVLFAVDMDIQKLQAAKVGSAETGAHGS